MAGMKWTIRKHLNNWVVSRKRVHPSYILLPISYGFKTFHEALEFVEAKCLGIR